MQKFAFMKDQHYYLFFPTERNLKRTLDFYENSTQHTFCREPLESQGTSGAARVAPKLLPREPCSAAQHPAIRALNWVCECLYFILIYFVIHWQNVSYNKCFFNLQAILAFESFHRNAVVSGRGGSGGNLYWACAICKTFYLGAIPSSVCYTLPQARYSK